MEISVAQLEIVKKAIKLLLNIHSGDFSDIVNHVQLHPDVERSEFVSSLKVIESFTYKEDLSCFENKPIKEQIGILKQFYDSLHQSV